MTSPRPLNALEALGWTLAAMEAFGLTLREARLLKKLVVDAPGRFCSVACLSGITSGLRAASTPDRLRLTKFTTRARKVLMDIGLPRDAVENDPDRGYAIARHHAQTVRDLVEQSVAR